MDAVGMERSSIADTAVVYVGRVQGVSWKICYTLSIAPM